MLDSVENYGCPNGLICSGCLELLFEEIALLAVFGVVFCLSIVPSGHGWLGF